jgi:hypothetical protein
MGMKILDGVMLIDVEIAVSLDREVERAMAREELEHVIEEADAGRDGIAPSTFDRQLQQDLRLGRLTVDYRAAHR